MLRLDNFKIKRRRRSLLSFNIQILNMTNKYNMAGHIEISVRKPSMNVGIIEISRCVK